MKEPVLPHGIVVCPKSERTRQMVLGTDNQEKEPAAPKLPGAPFLYPNVPPYLGVPPPQKPTRIRPLVETGAEIGPTRVCKPFSLLELRQIKRDLGSYTDDPGKYRDTFQHITLAFDLMWKDIMVIFSQILSDTEHARILKEARRSAMGLHMPSDKCPVGQTVVPSSDAN